MLVCNVGFNAIIFWLISMRQCNGYKMKRKSRRDVGNVDLVHDSLFVLAHVSLLDLSIVEYVTCNFKDRSVFLTMFCPLLKRTFPQIKNHCTSLQSEFPPQNVNCFKTYWKCLSIHSNLNSFISVWISVLLYFLSFCVPCGSGTLITLWIRDSRQIDNRILSFWVYYTMVYTC